MKTNGRKAILGGAVSVALLAILALLIGFPPRTSQEAIQPSRQQAPPAAAAELAVPAVDGESLERATAERVEPAAYRLICLDRRDRRPVSGISIYAEGARVSGPSGADGLLEFARERAQPLTLWGAGWRPVFLRTFDATPETVLMDAAAAQLEVRLRGLDLADRVIRTLVQPHEFQVTDTAPWAPVLSAVGAERLRADQLPEGTYDVYVWVARGTEAPRCLSSSGVRVETAEPASIELDAAAPPAHEPDR